MQALLHRAIEYLPVLYFIFSHEYPAALNLKSQKLEVYPFAKQALKYFGCHLYGPVVRFSCKSLFPFLRGCLLLLCNTKLHDHPYWTRKFSNLEKNCKSVLYFSLGLKYQIWGCQKSVRIKTNELYVCCRLLIVNIQNKATDRIGTAEKILK